MSGIGQPTFRVAALTPQEIQATLPAVSRSATDAVAESAAQEPFSLSSYLLAAFLTATALSLPLVTTHFPPITDLPQQTAQVRLAGEAVVDQSPYRLSFAAPGASSYGLFAISWWLFGGEDAGRLAYMLLAWLWAGGLMVMIRAYGRDPAHVPVAGLFFFSHLLYWGFSGFILGAIGFFILVSIEPQLRAGSASLSEAVTLSAASLALYSCHLFWFIAGSVWLLVATFSSSLPSRRRWLRLATPLPALAVFWTWVPQLRLSGFESETSWGVPPLARLAPSEWVDSILGGLKGPVEPLILGAVSVWLLVGLWQHRRNLRTAISSIPLVVAGSSMLLALVLPHRFQNTLHFAERWAPIGAVLLVVALPVPRFRAWLRWTIALILTAGLSLSTTAVWKRFEEVELAGLSDSLAELPHEPRLLGLDFYRLSSLVKTQPFFQNHAYAQVLKGGSLGFSFASFPSSPVVYTKWENPPWTPGLEWFPHLIFDSLDDFRYFDFVLVHASEEGHRQFERQPFLEPASDPNRWRLYRVDHMVTPGAASE
jgi:hypothetical protein